MSSLSRETLTLAPMFARSNVGCRDAGGYFVVVGGGQQFKRTHDDFGFCELGERKSLPDECAGVESGVVRNAYYDVQVIDSSSDTHTADTRLVNLGGQFQQIAGIGAGVIGSLANANLEIVGRIWSLHTSNYSTQTSTWLNSLHNRLKLAPTWGFSIGRYTGQ